MGQSKRDFISLRMSLEDYKDIPEIHTKEMEIKSIYPEGWEDIYKKDKLWLDRKEASNKAYADLKIREEEIRTINK